MIETQNTYSYDVTSVIDRIKAPIFNTSAVMYLAAKFSHQLLREGANIDANVVLHRMKCIEVVTTGKGGQPNEWRVAFEPGPKCEGCPLHKKIAQSKFGSTFRCARVERRESTSFQE